MDHVLYELFGTYSLLRAPNSLAYMLRNEWFMEKHFWRNEKCTIVFHNGKQLFFMCCSNISTGIESTASWFELNFRIELLGPNSVGVPIKLM